MYNVRWAWGWGSDPIPPWVATLPDFSRFLGSLVAASNLGGLLPGHGLAQCKILIREAAKLARDDFNNAFRDSPKTRLSNLTLIARITASNNTKLARFLLLSHPSFFASRIEVRQGLVMSVNPVDFALDFASSKKSQLDKVIHCEISKPKQKQNKSRISAAMRLAKLWRASGPVNSVAAIISESGETLTEHDDIGLEVGQVWGRTFAKTTPLPNEALDLLKSKSILWSMDFVHPPSVDVLPGFLRI